MSIKDGCKTVIGSPNKQLGMFWGEPGALTTRLSIGSISVAGSTVSGVNRSVLNAARNDCLAQLPWLKNSVTSQEVGFTESQKAGPDDN